MTMKPRYTITVEQLVASFVDVPTRTNVPENAVISTPLPIPFTTPKHPLPGTSYQFQDAISYSTKNPYFAQWRALCPSIPTSGSVTSGIVLFDGAKVIGGYTAHGNHPNRPPWLISVHPDYRNQGLATKAILEWFKAFPWVDLVRWPVNPYAKQAFISAHKQYVEWEITNGTNVPQNVVNSVGA